MLNNRITHEKLTTGLKIAFSAAIIAILLLTMTVSGVNAFTEPTQSTDNATDVILWFGDDITITDLQTAIVAGGTELAAALTATGNQFLTLAIVAFIIGLAYWQHHFILYVLSGMVTVVYGLNTACLLYTSPSPRDRS